MTASLFGLPLPKGHFFDPNEIELVNAEGIPATAEIKTRTTWPDGSIKWLRINALLAKDDSYSLRKQHLANRATAGVKTDSLFSVDEHGIKVNQLGALIKVKCKLAGRANLLKVIDHSIDSSSSLYCKAALVLQPETTPLITVSLELIGFKNTGEYQLSLRIENTNAAVHSNGTWDLGDPNSEWIEQLTLEVNSEQALATQLNVSDAITGRTQKFNQLPIKLSQRSSGGENWQSPIHKNSQGLVEIKTHGFEVSQSTKAIATGFRAEPWLEFQGNQGQKLFLCIDSFWQNFPAEIEVDQNSIQFLVFPSKTELQAGESKQWHWQVGRMQSYLPEDEPTYEANAVEFSGDFLNQSDAFTNLHFSTNTDLDKLTKAGIAGNHSFFKKRELSDEFGWRNFGELYADHEAIGQPEKPTFISHYNNQYDSLLGLTIQAVNYPREPWFELAKPLAQHIKDIDIYNTTLDKPEYNGGLFWHTDHYLPAETCTHRTYSKHHTSVYDGHQGGGGPGGQHCYTTGLLLHALLFQDSVAEKKVKQLTHWIDNFYNGGPSILGRLHRFLTIDLKANQLTNVGIVFNGYRYPLDRGTGNYLNALLDLYELTNEQSNINTAAYVIRNTVGLADDLSERKLEDVESAWFYTIFLQAVIKFLLLKESLEQNDQDYAYGRKLLEKFGQWMLQHETPYLSQPEKLEFPTDTWAAQDIRKAVIFRFLAHYDGKNKLRFQEKSEFFYSYVIGKLNDSDEATTTRCLAILMQNVGQYEKAKSLEELAIQPAALNSKDLCHAGTSSFVRLIEDLIKKARQFSLRSESHWLKSRLGIGKRGPSKHD